LIDLLQKVAPSRARSPWRSPQRAKFPKRAFLFVTFSLGSAFGQRKSHCARQAPGGKKAAQTFEIIEHFERR